MEEELKSMEFLDPEAPLVEPISLEEYEMLKEGTPVHRPIHSHAPEMFRYMDKFHEMVKEMDDAIQSKGYSLDDRNPEDSIGEWTFKESNEYMARLIILNDLCTEAFFHLFIETPLGQAYEEFVEEQLELPAEEQTPDDSSTSVNISPTQIDFQATLKLGDGRVYKAYLLYEREGLLVKDVIIASVLEDRE